ncbi:hypothetical protein DRJ16_07785 [Candidatus Woesearchaeota archaeon]|nr:MAG: hypothetical protein DRJ16_07785 [Candidatus Woesearchaeota archaeon]
MITRIKVTDAKRIINSLREKCFWRFTKGFTDDMIMRVNFYDDGGYEYNRDVYIKANKRNDKLIVYVNKRDFPSFMRDDPYLDDWIIETLLSYIDDKEVIEVL